MADRVTMRGADAIVRTLEAEGIELVTGTIGHATFELADALMDSSIRNFHPAVEYGGAFIAEGFNRMKGRASAVVTGTAASGPPIVWGLTNAQADSIPLVAIVGSSGLQHEPHNTFQPNPSAAMAAPVVKSSQRILRGETIPDTLRKAFQTANSGRPGAVMLELPYNLAWEKFEYDTSDFASAPSETLKTRGDTDSIVRAIGLLRGAKRPAILAGGGVVLSGAEKALRELAELTGTPVSVTTTAKGAFPDDHPLTLGHSGVFGWRCANEALNDADVLLAIGCRFGELGYAQQWAVPANWKLIHVDIDSNEIGRSYDPEVGVVGDAKLVLEDMIDAARDSFQSGPPQRSQWTAHIQELKQQWFDELGKMLQQPTDGVHPGRFFKNLRQVLPQDGLLVTEPTQVMQWALQCFDTTQTKTHLSPAGWGSLGWAVPAVLGAKLAEPDKKAVSVSGDWAFHYNMGELATVERLGLPVVCVVFDDNAQLCNVGFQAFAYGEKRTPWSSHKNPDFTKLGEAFGLKTARIETDADVKPVMEKALNSSEPWFVSVRIDPAVGAPATGSVSFGPPPE